jgi:hypothetical protein
LPCSIFSWLIAIVAPCLENIGEEALCQEKRGTPSFHA